MADACFCPSCGYNLKRDEIVERDGWLIDPRGAVSFEGAPLRLSPFEQSVLHTLASSAPRVVSLDTLVSRASESADRGVVSVIVCRLRKKLAAAGVAAPVTTVWGKGYAWGVPA